MFRQSENIVNSDKFQGMLLNKKRNERSHESKIDTNIANASSIILLIISINDELISILSLISILGPKPVI